MAWYMRSASSAFEVSNPTRSSPAEIHTIRCLEDIVGQHPTSNMPSHRRNPIDERERDKKERLCLDKYQVNNFKYLHKINQTDVEKNLEALIEWRILEVAQHQVHDNLCRGNQIGLCNPSLKFSYLKLYLVDGIKRHSASLSTRLAEGLVPHQSTSIVGNESDDTACCLPRAAAVVLQDLEAVRQHHLIKCIRSNTPQHDGCRVAQEF